MKKTGTHLKSNGNSGNLGNGEKVVSNSGNDGTSRSWQE
ncbi:unnamed protein product [Rhodiola kirilowii]